MSSTGKQETRTTIRAVLAHATAADRRLFYTDVAGVTPKHFMYFNMAELQQINACVHQCFPRYAAHDKAAPRGDVAAAVLQRRAGLLLLAAAAQTVEARDKLATKSSRVQATI